MGTEDLDVKAIRARLGLTQQGLADALGVNLSTVWRWENGQPPRGAARTLLAQMEPTPATSAERAA
ncbi:helix-turn-helix domain-containing protein [Mesorhizobium australicum]|uniref:helix-turn-helix domain-containing protein n=1 Tax=Mesorhizobium australicum TaxID=536018 RepID=UPI003336C5A1